MEGTTLKTILNVIDSDLKIDFVLALLEGRNLVQSLNTMVSKNSNRVKSELNDQISDYVLISGNYHIRFIIDKVNSQIHLNCDSLKHINKAKGNLFNKGYIIVRNRDVKKNKNIFKMRYYSCYTILNREDFLYPFNIN